MSAHKFYDMRLNTGLPFPFSVCVYRAVPHVAAAILAAVEGGILPPGTSLRNRSCVPPLLAQSAGQDARLYGRQDACRYGKHIPFSQRGEGNGDEIPAHVAELLHVHIGPSCKTLCSLLRQDCEKVTQLLLHLVRRGDGLCDLFPQQLAVT